MKIGDTIFMHISETKAVHIVAKIVSITDKQIDLYVINGAYNLAITEANDCAKSFDYNTDIDNFKKLQGYDK